MASNIAIQTYALSVFFALLAVIWHFNKIVAPIAETPLKLLVFRDGGG